MWKYFKVVCKVIFPLIGAYFGWMIRYSRHPEKYDYKKRFEKVQKIIRKILKAFNVNFHVDELKEFYKTREDKPYLLISNHLSDLDPLVYIALAEKPITFVAKIETKSFPLIGRCIRILEGVFIVREDLKQTLKEMANVEKRLKSDNRYDFMIFPEGTRNKGNIYEPLTYHHGSFRPGFKANAPIQCFVSIGQEGVLTYKNNKKKFDVYIEKSLSFNSEDYKNKKTSEIAILAENDAKNRLEKYNQQIVVNDKNKKVN